MKGMDQARLVAECVATIPEKRGYSTALRRFIHYIVDLRRTDPGTRILMTKLDFKAAYRLLHTSDTTASQAIVIIEDMALLALCMTFEGAPNPSMWSDISEVVVCDTCMILFDWSIKLTVITTMSNSKSKACKQEVMRWMLKMY